MESKIDLAKSLLKQRRYKEAIDTCHEILDKDSNSINALKVIAAAFLATKRVEEARLYLNQVINIKPDFCTSYIF